ncbi:hypothetical protein [Ancylobacter oerskovii]|uniref:Uncharacterized protein n=1 Tax=Ancylobacter oerskovii TaxID=459519 RepID=A0ABW4Z591_9HYPH|nr:hypothetical protein [Ancylobacter oerskovii]
MPLNAFIVAAMKGLETEAEEVFVEEIPALRDNPGSGEHALVNTFNEDLVASPIPVWPCSGSSKRGARRPRLPLLSEGISSLRPAGAPSRRCSTRRSP